VEARSPRHAPSSSGTSRPLGTPPGLKQISCARPPTPKGRISRWWKGVQASWNEHVATIRQNIDERRSEHDLNAAQRAADNAEDDAAFAVDYAYAAIEEAEYAVLDATLARMNADSLAKGTGS
jgi:hypothetical protein